MGMARKKKNTDIAERLGKNIKKWRLRNGWTQEQLAEMLNIEIESVSRFERGIRSPSLERLGNIADILGVPVSTLLDDESAYEAGKEKLIAKWLTELGDHESEFILSFEPSVSIPAVLCAVPPKALWSVVCPTYGIQ